MPMFEYLVVYISDTNLTEDQEMDMHLDADRFTEKLNEYGKAGWELVSFIWEGEGEQGAKACFKRVKA